MAAIGGLSINNPLALNSSGGSGLTGADVSAAGNADIIPTNVSAPVKNTNSVIPQTNSTVNPATGSGVSAADQTKINQLVSLGTSAAVAGGQGTTSSLAGSLNEQGQNLSDEVQTGQNNINLARTQIGTTQINSIKQLMQTIKDGLTGTGVQLGNSNALDSSAATAAARAYANYGNEGVNSANNTAATGNEAQDVAQNNLDLTSTTGLASIKAARDAAIGTIQANAAQALDGLATSITYLGGSPNAVNVKQIQAQIIANAQNELNTVDQNIQSLVAGGTPANTPDQTAQAAEAASNAGVVPSSGTTFNPVPSTSTPASTLGGAPTSLIPLTVKPQNTTGS
jgi:hypothetical protein